MFFILLAPQDKIKALLGQGRVFSLDEKKGSHCSP
jgi:hypothetical protein